MLRGCWMDGFLLSLLRPIGGANVASLFDALIYQSGFMSLYNKRGTLVTGFTGISFGAGGAK